MFLMVFIYPLKADIVVSNWDGYSAPDIMETFESATGVKGEMSFHATNEEIIASEKQFFDDKNGRNAKITLTDQMRSDKLSNTMSP